MLLFSSWWIVFGRLQLHSNSVNRTELDGGESVLVCDSRSLLNHVKPRVSLPEGLQRCRSVPRRTFPRSLCKRLHFPSDAVSQTFFHRLPEGGEGEWRDAVGQGCRTKTCLILDGTVREDAYKPPELVGLRFTARGDYFKGVTRACGAKPISRFS